MLWTYIDLAAAPLEQKKAAEMQSLQFKPNELEGYIHKKTLKNKYFKLKPRSTLTHQSSLFHPRTSATAVKCNPILSHLATSRSRGQRQTQPVARLPLRRGHAVTGTGHACSRGHAVNGLCTLEPRSNAVKRGQFAVTRFCNYSSMAFSARTTQS